mgnify:CR=1 FL=1
MSSFQNIPVCDKLNQEEITFYKGTSIEKLLVDLIQGDCWCVVSKYKCSSDKYVEFNSYLLEPGELKHNFNPEHQEYVTTQNKILGKRNREWISNNPEKYLNLIDYCQIYLFGKDSKMFKLYRKDNIWTFKCYNA